MTTRVYVGNLPMDIRTREVEDLFYKYGRIKDIDVKFPSRPPAFAFVDFEDSRDADDAIDGRDGYEYDGHRLRVEPANASGRRGGGGASSRFPRNVRGTGEYCVEVSNLPPRASWQDLKDYMRKAGDVVFSEVDGRGGAVVEYTNKKDVRYAVEKLDDTEFRNRTDRAFIRVRIPRGRRSRSASGSRSRSRSRSGARSSRKKSRSRSRSRSQSATDRKSRSKSSSPSKTTEKEDKKESSEQTDAEKSKDDATTNESFKEEPSKEESVQDESAKEELAKEELELKNEMAEDGQKPEATTAGEEHKKDDVEMDAENGKDSKQD